MVSPGRWEDGKTGGKKDGKIGEEREEGGQRRYEYIERVSRRPDRQRGTGAERDRDGSQSQESAGEGEGRGKECVRA